MSVLAASLSGLTTDPTFEEFERQRDRAEGLFWFSTASSS